MVEGGWRPAGGGVAGSTIGAKAALVSIFFRMAGITIAGCPLENMSDMTILAGHIDVLTIQFEVG